MSNNDLLVKYYPDLSNPNDSAFLNNELFMHLVHCANCISNLCENTYSEFESRQMIKQLLADYCAFSLKEATYISYDSIFQKYFEERNKTHKLHVGYRELVNIKTWIYENRAFSHYDIRFICLYFDRLIRHAFKHRKEGSIMLNTYLKRQIDDEKEKNLAKAKLSQGLEHLFLSKFAASQSQEEKNFYHYAYRAEKYFYLQDYFTSLIMARGAYDVFLEWAYNRLIHSKESSSGRGNADKAKAILDCEEANEKIKELVRRGTIIKIRGNLMIHDAQNCFYSQVFDNISRLIEMQDYMETNRGI